MILRVIASRIVSQARDQKNNKNTLPILYRNGVSEHQSLFPDVFRSNFYEFHSNNNNGFDSSSFRPHFQQKRKVIPYHLPSTSGASRYQPAKHTTYRHKKRQQNPYYGRKKRSAM